MSQRKAISDRIAAFPEAEREAAVRSLLAALLEPDDPKSYRVDLYISRTLAKMKPDWGGTSAQCAELRAHTRASPNYRDTTFRLWADRALAPCS